MPEEIAIIVVISIVAGTFLAVVKAILGYFAAKNQAGSPASSSLTTSELHAMIRGAVEEATAPLAARVDALEHRRLAEPMDDAFLTLPDEESTGADVPAGRRRRIS